ncbi:hypothetical protein Gorai_014481, partial [Gossypium raimondii]|nr:hypothetical protein [Gossypium raimondii]
MENSGRNMENDIANLTLEDDEDDILTISNNRDAPIEVYDLDSFSQIKMESETNVAHMGWDLSIQAQSKRALTMNSFWLKGGGNTNGGIMAESINPISRINLEEELRGVFGKVDMEHDSKEQYWEAEGKKATWG